MSLKWRSDPLALAAAAGLLMAGCAAPTGDTEREPPAAARAPAGHAASSAVAKLTGCDEVSQQSPVVPASTPRLPDIDLPCLTAGPAVNPTRLSGRLTVVNLWATWCQPCREEMPTLQAVHRRNGNRVQFLGVNTKDRPEWASEFLQQVEVTYSQVIDREGQLMTSLRSPGLPVTVVLDAEGRITGRHVGRISEQQLTSLLSKG